MLLLAVFRCLIDFDLVALEGIFEVLGLFSVVQVSLFALLRKTHSRCVSFQVKRDVGFQNGSLESQRILDADSCEQKRRLCRELLFVIAHVWSDDIVLVQVRLSELLLGQS